MVGLVRNELVRVADVTHRVVVHTAAVTVNEHDHEGRINGLSLLAGFAVTLPAATGSGAVYKFMVHVVRTSGSYTITAAGSDDYEGHATLFNDSADTASHFDAAGTAIFTWNATTTGGAVIGDWVEFTDIVSGTWAVRAVGSETGSVSTPFSG